VDNKNFARFPRWLCCEQPPHSFSSTGFGLCSFGPSRVQQMAHRLKSVLLNS
jgi:hypothetical protein